MISRFQSKVFKKLAALPRKQRRKHINSWPNKAFGDIKQTCKAICKNPKITNRVLKKICSQKNNIRKIANSPPKKIKKILIQQKGKGIFTALAAGVIPLIVDQITKLVKG